MESNGIWPSRLRKGHIRLLVLHASSANQETACSVLGTPLTTAPKYHALSYAWNGTIKTRQIVISSRHVPVTESVHNALLDIRRLTGGTKSSECRALEDLPIWIDAVCINQDDTQERNEQVRQMEAIYSGAAEVLVYLGPVPHGTRNELSLLLNATRELSRNRLRDITSKWEMCVGWIVPKLRSRTWFDRAWVLQEVVLSKAAKVICGAFACSWDDLDAAVRSIAFEPDSFSTRNKALYDLQNVIARFKRLRKAWSSNSSTRSMMELSNAQRLYCTVDHDHVFAHFALFPAGELRPEAIDYARSVVEVYTFAARYTIGHTGFSPLSMTHAGEEPCKFVGLPSWVPDWSMAGNPRYYPWDLYAAGGQEVLRPPDDDFEDEGYKLVLRGFRIDSVVSTHHMSELCSTSGVPVGYRYVNPDLVAKIMPTPIDLEAVQRTSCADLACTYDTTAPRGMIYKRWNDIDGSENTVRRLRIIDPESQARADEVVAFVDAGDTDVFLIFGNGHIGTGRCHVQPGDSAVVFPGVTMPFIVRQRCRSNRYEIIGPAYIHGIMDGKAMDAFQKGKYELQEFAID